MGSRDALIYDVAATDLLWATEAPAAPHVLGATGAHLRGARYEWLLDECRSRAEIRCHDKPANRRYYVFQILGGIAIALLIGGALLVAATFNG
jgi:hypothetical protein